jgi:hypothetical protein
LVLNKISFIFYIVLTAVFAVVISLLVILVALNLKRYNVFSSIIRLFQFFKEKYLLKKKIKNRQLYNLPTNFSSASHMHSLNCTVSGYNYFYKNFDSNNEKNNIKLKMKNIYKLNNRKTNYNFFMIYNKIEAEFVHNQIAPILKAKPYYYTIALQHMMSAADNAMNSNSYNDYIQNSSIVVFIVSKNLLTELEYKLVCKTPKYKRVVILIDNINENVVKKLIKPKKIIKWQFSEIDEISEDSEKLFPFVDSTDEV